MKYLKVISWLFIVAGLTLFAIGCGEEDDLIPKDEDPKEEPKEATLKEKASFNIGAAIKTDQLKENMFAYTLNKHFSQITAEWEMKMENIWTSSTNYNWSRADELVNYAQDNDLDVHGHTLVWYKSFPGWFKSAAYDSTSFENHVKAYIQTTVGRYKGKVISWDVANEIFNDNGSLRSADCPVFATFNDPIAFYGRCFQYARDTDPDAKLFYNDYSVVLASGKRNSIKNMVSRFKTEGYPIDGIGDQFHYRVTTDKNTMRNGLNDMASTGLLIHISELDIIVNVDKSDSFVFVNSEKIKQAQTYGAIVEMYEALPDNQKFAISTWGLTDKYTWLTGWWHPKEFPLLFDENYQEKQAYEAFLSALQ
jgi:endo-1,4-beta-xylanase